MAKKKKKKSSLPFGRTLITVVAVVAVLSALGYIGKQSMESSMPGKGYITTQNTQKPEDLPNAPTQKPTKAPAKTDEPKNTPTSEPTATQTSVTAGYASDASVKKLLQNAIKPIGSTMFVYGGGWNSADTGAGKSAVTIGLSSEWKAFADKQDSTYNYRNVSERAKGLDSSGYIGWVLYNTLRTQSGGEGFVVKADTYDEKLSSLGLGKRTPKEDVTIRRPGDIMCSQTDGFAYIVVGPCSDGSLVVACASPPGVRLCGTPSADGNTDSEAVILVEQVMNDRYGNWYQRYPDCSKGYSYLTNYDKFSPDTSKVIKDSEGLRFMNAQEVINLLF